MTRTLYHCAATLDGYIAEADDTIAWLEDYEGSYDGPDAQPGGGYERFYAGVGALVMGSVTYEWVLANARAWPYPGKPTWVLSSRALRPPSGEDVDVRIGAADVGALHPQLVAAAGERDVWIVGGGAVASQFADAGLLDEVSVTIVPVVLAGGKPLFARRLPSGPLQLTEARPLDNGMVSLRYAVPTELSGG